MAGKMKDKDKHAGNGEQSEKRGSAAQEPGQHDQGRMAGQEGRQYDAQGERRREDEQQEVNEEAL